MLESQVINPPGEGVLEKGSEAHRLEMVFGTQTKYQDAFVTKLISLRADPDVCMMGKEEMVTAASGVVPHTCVIPALWEAETRGSL